MPAGNKNAGNNKHCSRDVCSQNVGNKNFCSLHFCSLHFCSPRFLSNMSDVRKQIPSSEIFYFIKIDERGKHSVDDFNLYLRQLQHMERSAERKFNRHRNFNYSLPGFYYVTICIKNRGNFFGEIRNGKMILNEHGEFTTKCWLEIPNHYPDALLDEFIIMPNHVHGIVIIKNNDAGNNKHCSSDVYSQNAGNNKHCSSDVYSQNAGNNKHCSSDVYSQNAGNNKHCSRDVGNKNFCSLQWQTKLSRSLSSIIRGFKIGVTKYFRTKNNNYFQWQKSYYDRVLRDQDELEHARWYVRNNPRNWNYEKSNPTNG